jgi:transposase
MVLLKGKGLSLSHDKAGWSRLIEGLAGFRLAAVGLEPSRGYERGLVRALLAVDLSVRRINPNRLRQFARARDASPRTIASMLA